MQIVTIASDNQVTVVTTTNEYGNQLDIVDALAMLSAATAACIREGWSSAADQHDIAATMTKLVAEKLAAKEGPCTTMGNT